MAQGMGRDVFGDARLQGVSLDAAIDLVAIKALFAAGEKERAVSLAAGAQKVFVDGCEGRLANGHNALLASLPKDADGVVPYILDVEVADL